MGFSTVKAGYSVLHIVVNKPLFSFYIIQFTPVIAATLVALTAYVLKTI